MVGRTRGASLLKKECLVLYSSAIGAAEAPAPDIADLNLLHQLELRPSRARDFEAENDLLGILAGELTDRPDNLLQKLTDTIVERGLGDSCGISLRETTESDDLFRWIALSGERGEFKGATIAFGGSPCSLVVRHDTVLLLDTPEHWFPLAAGDPPIHEILLVPFHAAGKPIGTLWIISHDAARRFETEDVRLLQSLSRFAAAGYQVAEALGIVRAGETASKAAAAADLAGLNRLHLLYARLAVETDLQTALREIVAAAADLTGTDRGVLQLVSADGEHLEIAVHHGYGTGTAFTEHVRYHGANAACDAAREHLTRVMIEDVANFPGLAGTIDREILLAESICATQSTPMIGRTGKLIGVLNTQFDRPHRPLDRELGLMDMLAWTAAVFVERHAADTALRESETRFRELGEASSDVIWIRNADTLAMEYLSPAFEAVYGAPCEAFGDTLPARILPLIHPGDRPAFTANLARMQAGERVQHEFRIVRPADGMVRWIRSTDFPLPDALGRIARIGGIGQDVTDEKATAGRLGLLVAELQHRTRNVMAVVRSLADTTLRASASLDEFSDQYRIRLEALGRVQGLLSRLETGDRVTFDELVHAELSALGAVDANGTSPRVTLDGPKGVRLKSSNVQTLALALHELATNAAKYGAIAQPQGRLHLRWRVQPAIGNAEPLLVVEWRESGVVMPVDGDARQRTGFGRELIEHALPYELDAETSYVLGPDGVRCTVSVSASSILADQDKTYD